MTDVIAPCFNRGYLRSIEIANAVSLSRFLREDERYIYNILGFLYVLFDTAPHLTAGPLEETEKYVKPHGKLGEYL